MRGAVTTDRTRGGGDAIIAGAPARGAIEVQNRREGIVEVKNAAAIGWLVAGKANAGEALAAAEGILPDAAEASRESEVGQGFTIKESIGPNSFEVFTQGHAGKVEAAVKSLLVNIGDAVGNRDAG